MQKNIIFYFATGLKLFLFTLTVPSHTIPTVIAVDLEKAIFEYFQESRSTKWNMLQHESANLTKNQFCLLLISNQHHLSQFTLPPLPPPVPSTGFRPTQLTNDE